MAVLAWLTTLDTLLLLPVVLWQQRKSDDSSTEPNRSRRRRRFALFYGTLCVCRMWTNLKSAELTTAINVQMTALLLPFVTAAMARVYLGEVSHPSLCPALILSVAGTMMVLAGQGTFSSHAGLDERGGNGHTLSASDAAGIGLQMVSTVLSAMVKIALKSSEGVLSKAELMLSQMAVTGLVAGAWSVGFDLPSLAAVARMDAAGWGCFFGLAIGVYLCANAMQIVATRRIGASNHTASNSLRLLTACLGSWLLLNEPVQTALEWAGLLTIAAALTGMWVWQHRSGKTHALVPADSAKEAVPSDAYKAQHLPSSV
jgi:drug/metabolite transporter (DMT)-like permease